MAACIISTAQQASPKLIHISDPVRAQVPVTAKVDVPKPQEVAELVRQHVWRDVVRPERDGTPGRHVGQGSSRRQHPTAFREAGDVGVQVEGCSAGGRGLSSVEPRGRNLDDGHRQLELVSAVVDSVLRNVSGRR